jgi:type IV pilus assembly protein PilF
MKSRILTVWPLLLALGLTGCVHNDPRFKKASNADQAATNLQLSIEYMKLGKMAESRDFIERALEQDADSADVQMTAGLVFERLKEMPKAERAYSTAYRIAKRDPNMANAYAGFLCRTGKAQQGEKLFVEAAANPVYQTPEVALVNAGVCVRGVGDNVDAERYFKRALALKPNLPEALLQLGNIEFDRGDAADALDVVKRYLAVNPPTPEVLWLGFRSQRKLGDAVSAAQYARRVQTEFPNSEQALMMRSGVDR